MAIGTYNPVTNPSGVVTGANIKNDTIPPQAQDTRLNGRYVLDNFTDIQMSASPGGGASVGTDAAANVIFTGNRWGVLYKQVNIGTLTIFNPTIVATGLEVGFDNAVSEGAEFIIGAQTGAVDGGRLVFQPSVDKKAWFARGKFTVADVSGAGDFLFGVRKNQAYQATFTDYTDYALMGWLAATANPQTITVKYKGGTGSVAATSVSTGSTFADAGTHTFGVTVYGNGKVKWQLDDVTVMSSIDFGFTTTDYLLPFFRYANQGAGNSGSLVWNGVEVGFLPEQSK